MLSLAPSSAAASASPTTRPFQLPRPQPPPKPPARPPDIGWMDPCVACVNEIVRRGRESEEQEPGTEKVVVGGPFGIVESTTQI